MDGALLRNAGRLLAGRVLLSHATGDTAMTDTQRARIQRRRDGGSRRAGSGERLRRRTRSGCSHGEILRPPASCARVGPGRVLARCSVASRWCVVVSCSTSAGPAPDSAALPPDTLAESCGGWVRHPGDAEADHHHARQRSGSGGSADGHQPARSPAWESRRDARAPGASGPAADRFCADDLGCARQWGPMLSPRVPNLVPIPGPRMERETSGQRPRPNYGHPHPLSRARVR